jgi:hypothetical protein
MNKVKILGAETLKRYSEKILRKGFTDNGWTVVDSSQDCTLYQIHGAPGAVEGDKLIIREIKKDLSSPAAPKVSILLHRPDEIQDRHPEVKDILENSNRKFGLVFFGKWHINDPFYDSSKALKTVIPHGFFEFEPITQTDPIIIGTNTTWGEMRSTKQALELIDNLFDLKTDQNIIGYLGGKPADELDIEHLKTFSTSHLADVNEYAPGSDYSGKKTIFIDLNENTPEGMGITFNTQLYFYNGKIRTGESSGSAHTSLSIPVVFEMNDAEKAEGLEVVKVPYFSVNDVETADFSTGAKLIMNIIKNGKYLDSLNHNLSQSKIFDAKNTAKKYIELFNTL